MGGRVMRPNRFPGHCASCQRALEPGDGVAKMRAGKWVVACKSEICHVALRFIAGKKHLIIYRGKGLLIHPYDPESLLLLRAAPGARFDKAQGGWWVSIEPANIARTIEIAQKLGCFIDRDVIALAAQGTPLTQVAQKRAEQAKLYPFQKTGVRWLASRDRALLADDLGLGKTIQVLVALPHDERVLVIAPASVKYNWRNEAAKWRPEYRVTVLEGRGVFRAPELGEILVINYEILPEWLLTDGDFISPGGGGELRALSHTILVVDEAHKAKNYKAKQTRKVKALSGLAKRSWFLTGTPLLNRPFDLWGVLSSGGMAKEVFGDWNRFIELFGGRQNSWGAWEFNPIPSPEVPERLRRVSLRRRKLEVLPELPGKTYQDIMVDEPTGRLKKKLDALMKLLEERGEIVRGRRNVGKDELPDFTQFSEIRSLLATSRIPAMLELVEAAEEQGESLIVWSAHRAPIEALSEREGWGVILGGTSAEERTEIVRRFQEGETPKGIACTIGAGGVGITLTRASVEVFVDRDWTPSLNLQAEDRAVRIGQKAKGVLIQRLYTNHPLDIHIHNLLTKKQLLIEAAIDSTLVLERQNEVRP